MRRIPFALLMVCVGGCAPAIPGILSSGVGATAAQISSDDLRLRVGILAHDTMQGRETGMPEAGMTARYLAAELARLGLRPAGDAGTFLQRVPLQKSLTTPRVSATIDGAEIGLGLNLLIPLSGIAGLPEASVLSGAGPLVFAGHLADPDVGAAELTADQLRSAIVLLRIGLPAIADTTRAAPRPALAPLFGPTSPASAVFLVAEEAEADLWVYASEIARKGELTLGLPEPTGPGAPPFFLISAAGAERLLNASLAESRAPRLSLGRVQYSLTETVDSIEAWNVVGVLPGFDAQLSQEYLTLGAHYDHVGAGEPVVDGDSIFNGADDNASGTSLLLEVVEAMAVPTGDRPARSTLFVWHTGEEAGLLGSEHFTDHPTVPRESIVANINIDMVGRNSPDSLFVVGASRLSSELGQIVEAVNRRQPRPFLLDYSYDPEGHPEMIYCRSDHYNYARYGIPIVFLTSGLHEDYHLPSDEAGKLDYDKIARAGDYVLGLAMEIGNRPGRLVVDRPVPPLGVPCS